MCDWMTAKTSSQNSRKTVLLQLESSWVVEKLMFFRSLYEKWHLFFQEYLRMLHKTSTRSKEGEIFRIILQTFFYLLLEDDVTVFFFLLTLKSAIQWDANHSAKKKKGNICSTSFGFEVKKNCTITQGVLYISVNASGLLNCGSQRENGSSHSPQFHWTSVQDIRSDCFQCKS